MGIMKRWSERAMQVAFLFLAAVLPSIAAAIDLTPLPAPFQNEIGIDYSEREGDPIVTFDFDPKVANPSKVGILDRVTGQVDTTLLTGLQDENKVATARQVVKDLQGNNICPQQWPVGTIFTGTGQNGVIAILTPQANGTYVLSTVTIPGATIFRGGLFHDRFCVGDGTLNGYKGGDLIVVSANGTQPTDPGGPGGNVYRVNAAGGVTFLKHIDRPAAPGVSAPAHLEGVIVVPNDPATYGPWAGKIVTGDEDRDFVTVNGFLRAINGPNPKIYAIDVTNAGGPGTAGCSQSDNGILSTSCSATFHVDTPVVPGLLPPRGGLPHPEDFDFIEGDFYGVAFNDSDQSTPPGQGHVFFAPSTDFIAANGNILITQEYPTRDPQAFLEQAINGAQVDVGANSGLFQVKWVGINGSPVLGSFVATELFRTTQGVCGATPNDRCLSQWEHVTFAPASEVKIVKSPDGNSFNIGDNINFTVVLTSTGPGTATTVILTDPLPTPGNLTTWAVDSVSSTGLITPAPSAASCSINVSQKLTCNVGSMAVGATFTVTVKTTTAGGANLAACTANGGRVDNTATVTADPPATSPQSDPGFWLCTPTGSYTLTKNPKNATYNIGDNINFTMVVASTGPGTANNVVLNDPLPTLGNLNHWTFTATGNPGGVCTISAANVLNCPFGNLANGQTRTVVVTTDASGGANAAACPGGQKLNNTATLTGTGLLTLTDTGDYVCTPGSYTLTKTPKNATYNIGDNISFTMVVASTGPGTANNVALNDPLPTLGNLNSWTITSNPGGCSITNNTLNCSFGNLANGASRTVMVSTNVQGGANATACPGGVKLNNTATLTGTGLPTLTDTGDYICTPPPGSYTLTKTPKNATYNIGDNISFTMAVASTGPGTANNVVLNDPLPTLGNLNSWIITSNPGGCSITNNTLNCSFGNLANGASRTVMVSTNVQGGANATACPGGVKLNNTATLTGTGLPTLTDTGDYICTPPGSYTLTKNPKNATYNIGDNINFTMVVTSTGPGTANNVVLNDPLPTLGNLNSWILTVNPGNACTIVSNTLNCPFGNLANGQTRTVTVATNAAGGANAAACPGGVKLNNTATLTGTGLPTLTDTGDYICTPGGKTFGIGLSSMEGAIKIDAGDFVNGGYSFKTNFTGNITIAGTVNITGACLDASNKQLGFTDTILVPLNTLNGQVFAGGIPYAAVSGSDWKPTGDANSVLSWQGSVVAPATLCGGNGAKLDASKGATFSTTIFGAPAGGNVTFRFKFRDPAAKGKANTNCLDTSDPNRAKADVCGASWSATKTDP